MKKIFIVIAFLFFSATAYAQPNAKKNLYLIDANGNVLELSAPNLSGSISITMPTSGGTLVTNNSTGGQTVNGGMTIAGGTSVGTSLALVAGATTRWWDPSGTNWTEISAADGQGANRSYAWPVDAPSDGDVLAFGTDGQLEWVTVSGATMTPTYNSVTLGNDDASPTAGTLILHDGTGSNSRSVSIKTANSLSTNGLDYTIPDAGADASFVMTEGAQTINGEKTFTDINVTGGSVASSTLTGALPAISGASLHSITAGNITANGTLPVLNGSNLTNLSAASITANGTLPVLNGSNLTNLSAANITGTATSPMSFGSQNGIRLYDATNTHYTALVGADDMNPDANITYEMPSAIGAQNQVLGITAIAGNTATLGWTNTAEFNTVRVKNNNGNHFGWVIGAGQTKNHQINSDNTSFELDFDYDVPATRKRAKFVMSGIANGATRTYTLPDADGTILLNTTSSNGTLGTLTLTAPSTTSVPLTVNGLAGQTGYLAAWYVNGVLTSRIDGSGNPYFPTGIRSNVTNITNANSPYQALATDYYIVANTSAGAITVKLPAAEAGRTIIVKKAAAGNSIVLDPGAATIDGASGTMSSNSQWKSFTLFSDGTNWYIYGTYPN